MPGMRKTCEAVFEAKVALEAVKGEKTITRIAADFGVHPDQTRQWRDHRWRARAACKAVFL